MRNIYDTLFAVTKACLVPNCKEEMALRSAISTAEWEYLAGGTPLARGLRGALDEIGALWPDSNPSDPAWRYRMDVQLAILKLTHDLVLELKAPRALKEFHADWLTVMGFLSAAADKWTEGLDNRAPSKIEEATTLLNRANELTDEMSSTLEAFLETCSMRR